jgi:hypothetical protein
MHASRLMIGGAGALALAAVLVGLSFGAPRALAGITVPCGATATPTATQVVAAVAANPTCTPVTFVKSATPTFTVTVLPSATAVPPTQAPPTAVPPTATATPSGGAAGQGVRPPDTGSGTDAGSRVSLELLLAGAALAVVGSGSLVVGARRRR